MVARMRQRYTAEQRAAVLADAATIGACAAARKHVLAERRSSARVRARGLDCSGKAPPRWQSCLCFGVRRRTTFSRSTTTRLPRRSMRRTGTGKSRRDRQRTPPAARAARPGKRCSARLHGRSSSRRPGRRTTSIRWRRTRRNPSAARFRKTRSASSDCHRRTGQFRRCRPAIRSRAPPRLAW